ncbi:MAG TPA: roadblock/LC7 domain-containing protein [Gemmatimonadaceae bacterium]|nr:roadblock/LC7 domain-containing protein [Gemmatimonadaceae bacterium]
MPTIHDLVAALRRREGVDAAVVLGRDGLLIDGSAIPTLDAEGIAALIPALVNAADELGTQMERGPVATAIVEYAQGIAIVSVLSGDAILLVVARPGAQLGALLFELRRHRTDLAALI